MKHFTHIERIFAILVLALTAIGVKAQDAGDAGVAVTEGKEWNFSKWDTITYKANATVDGLTVYASTKATVTIDANNKTVGGVDYTKRLKLGGSGNTTNMTRILAFEVTGPCTVTAIAASGKSSETRALKFASVIDGTVTEIGSVDTSSDPIVCTANYTGESAATIYVYSGKSGINLYDLKWAPASEPEATPVAPGKVTDFAVAQEYQEWLSVEGTAPTVDAEGNALADTTKMLIKIYENDTEMEIEGLEYCSPGDYFSGSYQTPLYEGEGGQTVYTVKLFIDTLYSETTDTVIIEAAPFEAQSISPDPTASAQEYLSNIILSFDREVYTSEGSTAVITLTNSETNTVVNAEAYAMGTSAYVTVTDPDAIVAAEDGSVTKWTLNIPEGIFYNEAATYCDFQGGKTNTEIEATYVIGQLVYNLVPDAITPDSAKAQETLPYVALVYADSVYASVPDGTDIVAVCEETGEKVSYSGLTQDYDNDYVAFTFAGIKAPDTGAQHWTITIPEGIIYNEDAVDCNFTAGKANPELTIKYTLGGSPTGISSITVGKDTNAKVYTIGGQQLQKSAQKGLYIINGKKAVLK